MKKGVVGHQVVTFVSQRAARLTFDKCPGAHLDAHSLTVGPKYVSGAYLDPVSLQQLLALPSPGGTLLIEDLRPEVDSKTATLTWLVGALEHARSRGQSKVLGYLEEVADDVVFEAEMAARRTSLVG